MLFWCCWIIGALRGSPIRGHDLMTSGAGLGLCKRCNMLVPLNASVRKIGKQFEKRRDHAPYEHAKQGLGTKTVIV
jgi:hypothetical protein